MLVVVFSRSVTVQGPFTGKLGLHASGFTAYFFWWFNSECALGSDQLLFLQDCLALMLEPTLEFIDLGKLPSKNCSSWLQPPGKGQYKTLAPTAYSDTCWQCQWFSVSDGHEVDCRNHSPVSFFYKCLLLSASPESPVLAGWLSSHQPEVWPY